MYSFFFYLNLEIGLNVFTENVNKVVVIFFFLIESVPPGFFRLPSSIFSVMVETHHYKALREASGA